MQPMKLIPEDLIRALNSLQPDGMQRASCAIALSIALSLGPNGEPPEWCPVLPAGTFMGRDGRGPWHTDTAAVLTDFAANQAKGIDPVVDYDHLSMVCLQTGQKAEAAGWIKQLEIRDGETWARIEWNADAIQVITAKKWRYLSPVFDFDASGRVVRLVAVGLTNQPNLLLRALNSQENRMDPIDQLLQELGISISDAMDAAGKLSAALNAIKTLKDISNSTQTAMNSLRQVTGAAADADLKAVTNSIMTGFVPKAEYERVANSLQQLQAGTAAAEVDKALDEAIAAGKITPASRNFYQAMCSTDMKAFQDFVKSAPVVVQAGTETTTRAANSKHDNQQAGDNPLIANAKARAGTK